MKDSKKTTVSRESIGEKKYEQSELIQTCGGYSEAVKAVLELSRSFWTLVFKRNQKLEMRKRFSNKAYRLYRLINEDELKNRLKKSFKSHKIIDSLLLGLSEIELYKMCEDVEFFVKLEALLPLFLVRKLLGNIRPDSDLRYFVMRGIRTHFNCPLSSRTIHFFHLLAKTVNLKLKAEKNNPDNVERFGDSFDLGKDILIECREAIERDHKDLNFPSYDEASQQINDVVDCFFETCRAVGFVFASNQPDRIRVRTDSIDPEFLISHLFGILSDIAGFNELFGGGGIILPERDSVPEYDPLRLYTERLGARTIVIVGECGTGKSILALELAAEIGRKGGIAWLMPFEQSAEECLYTLESIQAIPKPGNPAVATDILSVNNALKSCNQNRGSLIILKPAEECYEEFLDSFAKTAEDIDKGCLRLLIVDPLNRAQPFGNDTFPDLRSKNSLVSNIRSATMKMIERVKRVGVNVLLIVEETATADNIEDMFEIKNDLSFANNISDTLIHLSVKKSHNYAQRYFEIKKSRMQREQRGEHPFSISAGEGPHIYPSSASVNARIRARRQLYPKETTKFGLDGIDNMLKDDSLYKGDVIAFQGQGGSFKTQLGFYFLSVAKKNSQPREKKPLSLFFAARDSEETIKRMLFEEYKSQSANFTDEGRSFTKLSKRHLKIVPLQKGFVNPGLILQRIEEEIEKCRLQGYWVHRVMIDNINQWEMASPLIREDRTFGVTLVELLRRIGATSLLICGEINKNQSVMQETIVNNADCVFQFDRFEFRGMRRIMTRVLKSRGMKHRLESFELKKENNTISIMPSSSLIRFLGREGGVSPIKIRLFFHVESDIQERYYSSMCNAVKAVLSENTFTDFQNHLYINRMINIGQFSAIDELQILQLDEYQLASHLEPDDNSHYQLYQFPENLWDEELWSGCLPTLLTNRIMKRDPKLKNIGSFHAVPFLENVSFLAYRNDHFKEGAPSDWIELADRCKEWEENLPREERKNSDQVEVFFDFPKVLPENYNCLFFEILLSIEKSLITTIDECPLRRCLCSDSSITAARVMRQLCRRAYLHRQDEDYIVRPPKSGDLQRALKVNHKALVWRHWYTTLNQMLQELSEDGESQNISIAELPGGVSIAGEWYLSIPAYSAAPNAGLEVIKLLTSGDEELTRVRMGVGLPTRKSFYSSLKDVPHQFDSSISPYLSFNLLKVKNLIENSFRRSNFGCYFQISNVLAFYLRKIIEIPEPKSMRDYNEIIENKIRIIFKEIRSRIDFVQNMDMEKDGRFLFKNRKCNRCRGKFLSNR